MKEGSLVICINDKGWEDVYTGELAPGPKLNEICTVSGFPKPKFITLAEYDHLADEGDTNNYEITCFREIQPPMDIDIESLIEEPLNA